MVATKSVRSRYWFARVDGPQEHLRQKCKELVQQINVVACLATYHVGESKENPHCHFVIELSSEPQKQSYAVALKKHFGIEKKSQYALDVWDGKRGAGACSYLFHEENPEIFVNKGFSEEDINDARAANAAVQRVIAVNKEKASGRFVDKALVHFEGEFPNEKVILMYMMQLCKDGDLYWPGTYRAKQLIEEVQIKLAGEDEWEDLVMDMARKIFR